MKTYKKCANKGLRCIHLDSRSRWLSASFCDRVYPWWNSLHIHPERMTVVTYLMQQSPSWEANSHSAEQEFYETLKSITMFTKALHLSLSWARWFPSYIFEIHSNTIFPSLTWSSEWSLPFWFFDQNFVCISHLTYACYIPCPSHLPRLDRLTVLVKVKERD